MAAADEQTDYARLRKCAVDGEVLLLGFDDVHDYLARYGAVVRRPLDGLDVMPEESLPGGGGVVGVVSAYPSYAAWLFMATSPGGRRAAFIDLAEAVRHAFPRRP